MLYSENKIVARTASITPLGWSSQKSMNQGLVELGGEFTFDFFHEQDRSKWLQAFETERKKRDEGDRFFAAKELVVKNYIANSPEDSINKNLVPRSMLESPRSFLYSDLLGRMNLLKDHVLPALRKTGAFRPITENMERQFFTFDPKSYDILTLQIPDQYKMRTIFKVTFRVYFDIQKYLEYLIVKKRAKFELHIWPDFNLKMTYDTAFPFVLLSDRNNFFNAVTPVVLQILRQNQHVLRYVYSAVKIRLDRVTGLQVKAPTTEAAFVITTTHPMSMLMQLIAGRIDIFNKNQVNSTFKIQKMDQNVLSRYNMQGTSTGAGMLMYLTALSIAAKKKPGNSAVNPREIEKVMKDIKSGKIKIDGIK